MKKAFELSSSSTAFKGRVFDVTRDIVSLAGGRKLEYQIVRHRGSAAIIPILGQDKVVLIKQLRPSLGRYILEIPAGTLEDGEAPEDCAVRELGEETGYKAGEIEKVLTFYPTSGYSDEAMHLFLAERLTAGTKMNEEDELIDVEVMSLENAMKAVDNGAIVDGKTIIGLYLAQRRLGPARAKGGDEK